MLRDLDIKPGLYSETSDRSAVNRWKDGLNVRFDKLRPEKVGGWTKQIAESFYGVCRAMLGWSTLTYSRFMALGTSSKLYLTDTVDFFDITPIRASGTLGADPFATVDGSPVITVTDTAHGVAVGDFVHFDGSTAVAGLDLDGEWIVTAVPDADSYTFDAGANANATTTGGGAAVDYEYEITAGQVDSTSGSGWGIGGWGLGTWGTPRSSSFLQLARIWSLAKWGEDLLASPINAAMYVWTATGGTSVRATLITQAPAQNRRILVSAQLRIAISFGSHDGSDPDPMLIRWSDSEDYTEWTPDITNLAGDKRLNEGNQIITAIPTRDEIAVITDTTIYAMNMTGDDLVFGFSDKGQIGGLAGPNAACDANGVVYGMGGSVFFTYDGQIKELDCEVWSKIFENGADPGFNSMQAAKVFAHWNHRKSEVIWFYCSADSDEVDRCVGVNRADGSWWLGTVHCTAFLSRHPFIVDRPFGTAIGPDGLNYLYQHETGVDADEEPLAYFLESWDVEIPASSNGITGASTGTGEVVYRVKKHVPDFVRLIGNHLLTIKGRKYPQGAQSLRGPVRFYPGKLHIDRHLRARQIAIRLSSDELGADIALAVWRVEAAGEGKR